MRSKKELEIEKQNEMILREWLFQEPIEIKNEIFTFKPLKQTAREIIKKDEDQLKEEIVKKRLIHITFLIEL